MCFMNISRLYYFREHYHQTSLAASTPTAIWVCLTCSKENSVPCLEKSSTSLLIQDAPQGVTLFSVLSSFFSLWSEIPYGTFFITYASGLIPFLPLHFPLKWKNSCLSLDDGMSLMVLHLIILGVKLLILAWNMGSTQIPFWSPIKFVIF